MTNTTIAYQVRHYSFTLWVDVSRGAQRIRSTGWAPHFSDMFRSYWPIATKDAARWNIALFSRHAPQKPMGRIAQEFIGRILFVDRISLSISGWGYWFAKVCWANCKTTTASQSCGHRAGQWKSPCNWSVASRGLWPEKLVRAASSDGVVEGVSSHLASLFIGKSCLYKCLMQSIPLFCIIHIHICTYRLYIYIYI